MKTPLRLLLTIDVEEEGLFGGVYPNDNVTVCNVGQIARIVPLLQDFDVPVTLLCTHSVFANATACRALDTVRTACRVEIGAHLHYWNTPPLEDGEMSKTDWPNRDGAYRSAGDVPDTLMLAKLHTLFAAGAAYAGQALTSFRMGRWDLHQRHWPLLAQCGVKVDASVRPLHCGYRGTSSLGPDHYAPDHFFAPPQPYIVDVGGVKILEVPLTAIPVFSALRNWIPAFAGMTKRAVQKYAMLSVLPVYHPLWFMQWATRRMIARGCSVIVLAWHSSEMMPGGAPHIPNAAAVDRLLKKLRDYIAWLQTHWSVTGLTLDDMHNTMRTHKAILAEGVNI